MLLAGVYLSNEVALELLLRVGLSFGVSFKLLVLSDLFHQRQLVPSRDPVHSAVVKGVSLLNGCFEGSGDLWLLLM